jgi:hypothetical protein
MSLSVSPSTLATLSVAVMLTAAGCRDNPPPTPTAPALLGARSSASKVTLDVADGGSTAGGTVTSNRGGIGCTFSGTPGAKLKGKCSQHFNTGTVVTLTAVPSGTGTRITWSGCTGATDDPFACEVTLDFSRTVKVAFSPPALSQALDVSSGAEGSGHITSSVPGIDCTITNGSAASTGCSAAFPTGTAVTLTATASSGSYLKAWAGAGCDAAGTGTGSTSGKCALTMDQPRSVVVSFGQASSVATLGRWDAPISWPAVAIHANVLPDGRVMTWGRSDHAPQLWDPASPA